MLRWLGLMIVLGGTRDLVTYLSHVSRQRWELIYAPGRSAITMCSIRTDSRA